METDVGRLQAREPPVSDNVHGGDLQGRVTSQSHLAVSTYGHEAPGALDVTQAEYSREIAFERQSLTVDSAAPT